MVKSERARAFAFTINNPTAEDTTNVFDLADVATYIIVGRETGEKEGTPHYQGYVYFEQKKTFSALKKLIPRAHIEVAKSSALDNSEYCKKGGDILIEAGPLPQQGRRNDLQDMVAACKQGASTTDLIERHTEVYAKYPRFVELCKRVYTKPRDPNCPPSVKCFYGPAGTGKTMTAYSELGSECYIKTPSTKDWWDGYDGHEKVIIDEADKGYLKLCEMLSILDRYPVKVNIKGSTVEFVATKIILTANKHPEEWYQNCTHEERRGLLRRINDIVPFGIHRSTTVADFDELDQKNISFHNICPDEIPILA